MIRQHVAAASARRNSGSSSERTNVSAQGRELAGTTLLNFFEKQEGSLIGYALFDGERVLLRGNVVFQGDVMTAVGSESVLPSGAQVIDMRKEQMHGITIV